MCVHVEKLFAIHSFSFRERKSLHQYIDLFFPLRSSRFVDMVSHPVGHPGGSAVSALVNDNDNLSSSYNSSSSSNRGGGGGGRPPHQQHVRSRSDATGVLHSALFSAPNLR